MDDRIIKLANKTLQGMSTEAHNAELGCQLKALGTDGTGNYATYARPKPTPEKAITILPDPSIGPSGSAKICSGELMVSGNKLSVSAYRSS